MNKFLERQIRKYITDNKALPEDVKMLLNAVSESYDHYERDRKMLERSIELTSAELIELNEQLTNEAEELRQKAIHLKASQHLSKTGSWELGLENIVEINSKYLYWSDETYRIFELIPKSIPISQELFFEFVHPYDRNKVTKAIKTTVETGQPCDIIHRIVSSNGEKIVQQRLDIVYNPSGLPAKLIGTIQDVTEQKRWEKELEVASRELRTLFENMHEMFFSVDVTTGQLIQMSNACELIYGRSVEAFRENPNLWYELVLEEDKKVIDANYSVMQAGKSFAQEYRIRHKNGSIRWVESRMTPTLSKEGKVIRLDGITSDITWRKQSEEALKHSEHKFRALIQNMADVIIVANEHGERVFVSESCYHVTGYTSQEMLGKASFSLAHPDFAAQMQEYLYNEVLPNPGIPKTIIYKSIRKDGRHIWCERTSINLFHDPVINGVVTNLRDITDRKEKEEALKISNEELQKSNSELDKFVYSVSHDIRAPLTSILGLVALSKASTSVREINENLNRIETAVYKLDGFIKDILDYSRNARQEVRIEQIHFGQIISDITDTLKFINNNAERIQVKMDIEDHVPFYSDKHRISVVLNNLISNAIKYHDPEKTDPFIYISIRQQKGKAVLIIEDNGLGIDQVYHTKVFDMFFRASVASVGSGLGLYIVKETLNKLNGTIQLESEAGKGSKFYLKIPSLGI